LGWLDFGARMYQADLGRWFNVDPMAEKYHDMTPYKYGLNNPIAYTDPNGMTEVYGVEMDLGATGSVTSVVDATPDVVENGTRYESMEDFVEQAIKDYYGDVQKKLSSSVQSGGCPACQLFEQAVRNILSGLGLKESTAENAYGSFIRNLKSLPDANIVIIGPGGQATEVDFSSKDWSNGPIGVLDLGNPNNVLSVLNFRLTNNELGATVDLFNLYFENPRNKLNEHGFTTFMESKRYPGLYYYRDRPVGTVEYYRIIDAPDGSYIVTPVSK
jgi:hypothetical protein